MCVCTDYVISFFFVVAAIFLFCMNGGVLRPFLSRIGCPAFLKTRTVNIGVRRSLALGEQNYRFGRFFSSLKTTRIATENNGMKISLTWSIRQFAISHFFVHPSNVKIQKIGHCAGCNTASMHSYLENPTDSKVYRICLHLTSNWIIIWPSTSKHRKKLFMGAPLDNLIQILSGSLRFLK